MNWDAVTAITAVLILFTLWENILKGIQTFLAQVVSWTMPKKNKDRIMRSISFYQKTLAQIYDATRIDPEVALEILETLEKDGLLHRTNNYYLLNQLGRMKFGRRRVKDPRPPLERK